MTRRLARIAVIVVAIAWSHSLVVSGIQRGSDGVEIAFVASSQAGTVALVDVAARAVVGTIDINPARVKSQGPGAPNYAQDTDVSPDGRTLYVSRGYIGDVAAFDLASGRLMWTRQLNTGPRGSHDADRGRPQSVRLGNARQSRLQNRHSKRVRSPGTS
jgi:DNA-binding beta-propeller fold protein YncE